jgi:penicillin-binding protein 1C
MKHVVRRPSFFVTLALLLLLAAWIRLGPLPDGLLDLSSGDSIVVLDRGGNPLYEVLGTSGLRGERLTAGTLPPALVRATLAAEDHRFFRHPGVDLVALARAARRNLAEGRVVEGGSTITQQVVKLLLARRGPGEGGRGLGRKLHEMVLALRVEHRLSKAEILAIYLNVAPYGNRIAGAQRASRAYFGVGVSMLTPAQAAFLAALPQQPSRFNPWQHPDRASRRGRRVIERMRGLGLIDARAADEALAERLALKSETSPFAAPHFVEHVLEGMWHEASRWHEALASSRSRPSRIHTTLDAALQAEVAGIIRSQRRSLDRHGAHAIAVAVLDNERSEWLAWEGSGDYFDAAHGGTIDGVVSPRQPGSALKPFTYALAFDAGYEPSSVLADVPSHFPTAEAGVVYSPRNYDGRYRGPMRARAALAGSENVPAVALLSELGPPLLVRFLRRAGFTTFDKTVSHYGLGITLGNAEVRLDELVAAYAALARGGLFVAPTGVAARAAEGADTRQLVSERAAFWTTDILSDDRAREYAFGRGSHLEFPFPVAAKTGTSQGYRDNWAVGYTREVTVGVWVGNFDRTPLRNSSGVTGAGPIFHQVMLAAARRYSSADPLSRKPESTPTHTIRETVCALSGMRANAWCPSRLSEWVAVERDRLPCSWHHMTDEGPLVVWPTQYQAWAAAREKVSGTFFRGSPEKKVPDTFSIVSPPDGATYWIDPTLRREFQTLPLQAASARGGPIEWLVDGKLTGRSTAHDAVTWPLMPGHHVISARDAGGRIAEATIVVK